MTIENNNLNNFYYIVISDLIKLYLLLASVGYVYNSNESHEIEKNRSRNIKTISIDYYEY